jgi:hypothetical protein
MRIGFLFLFLGLLPLSAQNAQLAGMQQDLADLRTEVEKLKLENADLRAALNRQKAGQGPSASTADAMTKARAETLNEVDRRLKQQTADVNVALAEIVRQVNAALGKPAAASPGSAAAAGGAEPATDVPQSGLKYRVKAGDNLTKIALRHGSKVEWILKANNLPSPSALKADVDIFIPQPDAAAR